MQLTTTPPSHPPQLYRTFNLLTFLRSESATLLTCTELDADGLSIPAGQTAADEALTHAERRSSRLDKLEDTLRYCVTGVFTGHVQSPVKIIIAATH